MFKKLIDHFINRVVLDKRGLFGSVGASIGGGLWGQSSETERARSEWVGADEYAETKAARAKWWEQLQAWGGQPGYGAIQPDWAGIWQNAQKKVQQYFWGSPTDPGVVGKVKASAARRGVSESPALENMIGRMSATESNVMSDMAVQQATKEAELSEAGRLNYAQQLGQLAGYNQQGTFYTPWEKTNEKGWNVEGEMKW